MQYDWPGVKGRSIRTSVRMIDSAPAYSAGIKGLPMQSAKRSKDMSWPRRIGLCFTVAVGLFAFVTTALAAAVAQNEALHSQFCHEIDQFSVVEPILHQILVFIGPT